MKLSRVLIYLVLILFAIFYLTPVYVLLITSMKSFAEVDLKRMWNPPKTISFESFVKAWFGDSKKGLRGLSQNFLNSLYLVIPATIISALLGSMNGYVLTKWKFQGANIIFPLLLFGMFIPYQSILIPLVQVLQRMKLYSTIYGLIFVHVVYGIPITTLIFRNYYSTIPTELIEAAKIDGADFLGIYRRIVLPVSMPAFAVVMIWQFTSIWNDFLFGLVVAPNPSVQPVTVALNNLAGSYFVEWNIQMAGALITALPPLLVYIFLGKYFMRGLLSGSLSGV
ncbi:MULTISPECIES: carbohydrate ABC transporter permease [Dictyoglomus]|jgi:glucose/mannose transport system permease protein|uniref:carbohydrate ABC transporter permease n=1 Tax=Dictyoglomus TaxID=13 RepID=UPI000CCDBFE5|nr:carbohydrate ABC transporter permease [Dictyoglomus turgidum]PNV79254.1 MAG: ABC transporter permease [Dictyoglomus turgidum]